MNHYAVDQLRQALRAGDLTGEQVVELLLDTLAPSGRTATIPVPVDDLAQIASDLRAASASLARAATVVGRIRAGQPDVADTVRAKNLRRIKAQFPDWRTNTPAVRKIARLLGVAVSTGHTYRQQMLADQRDDGSS